MLSNKSYYLQNFDEKLPNFTLQRGTLFTASPPVNPDFPAQVEVGDEKLASFTRPPVSIVLWEKLLLVKVVAAALHEKVSFNSRLSAWIRFELAIGVGRPEFTTRDDVQGKSVFFGGKTWHSIAVSDSWWRVTNLEVFIFISNACFAADTLTCWTNRLSFFKLIDVSFVKNTRIFSFQLFFFCSFENAYFFIFILQTRKPTVLKSALYYSFQCWKVQIFDASVKKKRFSTLFWFFSSSINTNKRFFLKSPSTSCRLKKKTFIELKFAQNFNVIYIKTCAMICTEINKKYQIPKY